MKKRLAFISENRILWQKIRLLVEDCFEVSLFDGIESAEGYDLTLVDVDTKDCDTDGALTLSYTKEDCDLKMPSSFEEMRTALCEKPKKSARLRFNAEKRFAFLDGREIPLTELEFKLLFALAKRKGAYVSREKLLDEVWRGEKDLGIINVYVHYLRTKLETDGEKIILSSRGEGYKIAERYLI